MTKKKYIAPGMEIEVLDIEDVIVTSNESPNNERWEEWPDEGSGEGSGEGSNGF